MSPIAYATKENNVYIAYEWNGLNIEPYPL